MPYEQRPGASLLPRRFAGLLVIYRDLGSPAHHRGGGDMKPRNLAWHFVGATLRDGSPIPANGKWLKFKGPLALCKIGLHFSRLPHQALECAPGDTLCLVEIGGEIIEPAGDDKGVCSRRKIIARMDATELLRYYARMQAVKALEYWETEPPAVVCDYLMTGDESIRDAARAAARDAAWAAAWDVAWAAARAAARDAAWNAAWAAARNAAWAAAWNAVWAAARAAARDAANAEFNALVYESFADFLPRIE